MDRKLLLSVWLLAISAFAVQILAALTSVAELEHIRIIEIVLYLSANLLGITLVTILGWWLSAKIGLSFPITSNFIRNRSIAAGQLWLPVCGGMVLGLAAVAADCIVFNGQILNKIRALGSPWSRLAVAYSAAVGEEILFRLFCVSLIVWLSIKFITHRDASFWIGIIVAACLFGAAHISRNAAEITLPLVSRALVLNGAGGIFFGWVYWRRGIESAIIAHFAANVTIYLIFPFFI